MNFWMANVVGNMLPLIAVEVMFGYHRELEHEADVYGVRMLNHAGYAPAEMAHALELLEKGPEVDLSEHSVFWADHPKLENRVKYTMELARQLGDGNSGKVDRQSYEAATQKVIVHDARLAMMLGRPRTTVAVAKRLVDQQPSNAEYQTLLGDGYRALGGRTAVPEPPELTDEGKDEARHMVRKMTLAEYDKALLEKPEGKIHWKSNCTEAEHAYHQALAIDSADGEAHRGLGYLYDSIDRPADAVAEFKRYLGLAPDARDARVIRMRLDALEKKLPTEPISKGGNS
jgi:predicted Zn-dependent protease